ncbi:uncharacterized protein B0J16DRAFT_167341 [Fusarium flagelliforme]|uniref:uncharacterized protein n=1 Tax=Fusarium flagelliforme TaxID=2675880 RepID=UPI001E8CA08B|nr:uncharacterized protein B0J16DRAFT_167341 [Fusarium flagelliforme]KAH7179176.1 hypothetical protein B0J16DRAFT_167341 [Fusarium flagelliforme]
METQFDNHRVKLPLEVILLVVENLIPGTIHRSIFSASNVVTKTLLSCTLVSKAVNPTATRLLWQNCLYIDSKDRLYRCRDSVSQQGIVTGRSCEAYRPTRLFLRLFPDPSPGSTPEFVDEIPEEDDFPPSPLEDIDMCEAVKSLLLTLAPGLKTIVVDMPLRSLYPADDEHGVRKLLREGFEALVSIEELVSINDELYLATKEDHSEPQVWTKWPNLQRISLYNVYMVPELWKDMLLCPQLHNAVFPRADSDNSRRHDIKGELFATWAEATGQNSQKYQGPEITIALCDWYRQPYDFESYTESWRDLDPDNLMSIRTVIIDPQYDPAFQNVDDEQIYTCKNWIRERALRGSLWDDISL